MSEQKVTLVQDAHYMEDCAIFHGDVKVWAGDCGDALEELCERAGIEIVRTDVHYGYEDEPVDYPESMATIRAEEAKAARSVWLDDGQCFHDPVDDTYTTEDGYQIDPVELQERREAWRQRQAPAQPRPTEGGE